MKYPKEPVTSAIYSDHISNSIGNPFLEALPEMVDKDTFFSLIKSFPVLPYNMENMNAVERRTHLTCIQSLFYPMDYMYSIYDLLYRIITVSCTTKMVLNSVRQLNIVHKSFKTGGVSSPLYSGQAECSAILGVPGIGKTSTVMRCLDTFPQVIIHTNYRGIPFFTKQITYLTVECPSDCSIKTLAYNIAAAVDRAIGSEYFDRLSRLRSASVSAIATQIKIICINHHIGVLVIDEIQNAVITAKKTNQTKPLIRFLVELTNDTSTGICFMGTMAAEEMFSSQEHLKRRTRGLRLLPLKPGTTYQNFLLTLWNYQFTVHKSTLTDKLANQFYDRSSGIPFYIIKLFYEAQSQAILTGYEKIDYNMLKLASERLNIQIPKIFSQGTYISDFSTSFHLNESNSSSFSEALPTFPQEETCERQLYANRRGRKKTQRDATDLIEVLKRNQTVDDMLNEIQRLSLMEEIRR